MNLKERIINGLYGCCVADAVGNFWEFHSNINPDHVIRDANNCSKLVMTDDSQMTAHGMLAINNLDKFDGDIYEKTRKSFTKSYLEWYHTQTNKFDSTITYDSELLNMKCMYSIQAPGNTCLSALRSLKNGQVVENSSYGCGSTMRLLPLVSFYDKKYGLTHAEVIELAVITGEITHKHSKNREAIVTFMDAAYALINDKPVMCKSANHISDLGEGWVATECVDMAIWAYCNSETFEDLLRLSISHKGDSDSTAAHAGFLWGLSGREVPQKYIDKLDALDAIKYVINHI